MQFVARGSGPVQDSVMRKEADGLGRICRAQAEWTTDPRTRTLLLELAEEYEAAERTAADPPVSPVEPAPEGRR